METLDRCKIKNVKDGSSLGVGTGSIRMYQILIVVDVDKRRRPEPTMQSVRVPFLLFLTWEMTTLLVTSKHFSKTGYR